MSDPEQDAAERARFRQDANGQWLSLRLAWQRGIDRTLEMRWLWLGLFLVFGSWLLVADLIQRAPDVEVGAIATREYTAPRDLLVPDEEATEERRTLARGAVLQVYDRDQSIADDVDAALHQLFVDGRDLLDLQRSETGLATEDGEEIELPELIRASTKLTLTRAQTDLLISLGFDSGIEEALRDVVARVYRQGVVSDKSSLLVNRASGISVRYLESGEEGVEVDLFDFLGTEEVADLVRSEFRTVRDLRTAARQLLVDLVLANLTANVQPNLRETQRRREAAAEETQAVFTQVRRGQVIARRGDVLTRSEVQAILSAVGGSGGGLFFPWLGTVLLLSLASFALWLGLRGEEATGRTRARLFCELLALLIAGLAFTKFGLWTATALSSSVELEPFTSVRSYLAAVPMASLALTMGILYGRRVALLPTLMFAILAERLVGSEDSWIFIYTIAGSLAALYMIEHTQFKQRSVILRVGLGIGLVNVLTLLTLAAFSREAFAQPDRLGFDMLCGLLGGALCAAAASFGVPVCESLFSITTQIKLVELSNTNLPLLRRLALEAPGTFQHSLMVANLGKAGCEAIGADATLAYTAALYHDVGKIPRPEYFIENQRGGANPHDTLAPAISARILASHIKDGVQLAARERLPRPLLDVIEQHHGTRKMTYFYERAVSQADDGETVPEADFRYPGPRPQDRVNGVLMLADGVEAAARTLTDTSADRIKALIQRIVDACLDDGQLDETDLTLSDLRRIRDAFLDLLSSLYHRRVDYPGYDFNTDVPAAAPQAPGRKLKVS